MKLLLLAGALSLLLLTPNQARASSLDGETITTTYLFPNTSTILAAPVATVVPGALLDFAGFANIDFSANNILITTTRNAGVNNVAFDGFEFSDPTGVFATVALDPSSTYAGFDASRISFNADNIFVNVEDLPGLLGQTISLDIKTPTTATPEPSSLLLLGTGLLGLGPLARRRLRFPV